MDDPTRHNILAAGAGATAMAGLPRVFAQQAGAGLPSVLIPAGVLNSTAAFFTGASPFDRIEEFRGQYRCLTADLRNAPSGRSTGPVGIDRPWDSYADDHPGLIEEV